MKNIYPSLHRQILVVEDDPLFQRLHCTYLERAAYDVRCASSGQAALAEFFHTPVDAILLDVGLPDMSGFEVLEQIRRLSNVPVVVITSYNASKDILHGFELGADDYLTKPFDPHELLARVEAVLRRAAPEKSQLRLKEFELGPLHVDFDARQVEVEGRQVRLTATEFMLLTEFIRNYGHVLNHKHLLTAVWGEDYARNVGVLRTTVHRLRQKIEPQREPTQFIYSVIGVGYCFAPD